MITGASPYATIPVTDMRRAREFYEGKLGFKPMMEDPAALMFANDAGVPFLVYLTNSASNGEHTLIGFQVDDIEAEVAALKKAGITFEEYDMEIPGVGRLKTVNSIAETGPVRTAWFRDPERNVLSLTQQAS